MGSEWYYDIASLRVPYGYEYGYIKVAIVQDTVVDEIPCLKTVTEFYNERGHLFDRKTGLVLYEGASSMTLMLRRERRYPSGLTISIWIPKDTAS